MRELILFIPEIIVAATILGLLWSEASHHGEESRFVLPISCLGLAAAILYSVVLFPVEATLALGGTAYLDGLVFLVRMLSLFSAALVIGISSFSKEIPKSVRTEQYVFVLFGTLGAQLCAISGNLLLSLSALVFLSLVGSLLLGFRKGSKKAVEASVKSYFFSVMSVVFFASGTLILFSHFGTFDYRQLGALISEDLAGKSFPVTISVLVLFSSLAVPLGVFPFHLGLPDVMQGAPAPTSAYFALIPRIAAIAIAIRLFGLVFSDSWVPWMSIVLGLSMVVSSLGAITERSAKRLLAGFTCVDSATLFLGILSLQRFGWKALFFQFFVAMISIAGAFFILAHFINQSGTDDLDELKPRVRDSVPELIYLILFLALWVPIPPMPGFFGKFVLWGEMVHQGHTGVAASAFFAFILLSVALFRRTYLLLNGKDRSGSLILPMKRSAQWGLAAGLGVPAVLFVFFSDWILGWVEASILKIFA